MKIAGVAGVALCLGVGLWVWQRPGAPSGSVSDPSGSSPSGARGFLPNPPEPTFDDRPPTLRNADTNSAVGAPGGPPTVPSIMNMWRMAIINKDADPVVAIDQEFVEQPGRFRAALIESAETDAEPRVRAFSTRVLGKFKDPSCAPTLMGLLGNPSEYVRGNAAWALGELHHASGGREAARKAIKTLRRLQQGDPSNEVRAAAALAIQQLQ